MDCARTQLVGRETVEITRGRRERIADGSSWNGSTVATVTVEQTERPATRFLIEVSRVQAEAFAAG